MPELLDMFLYQLHIMPINTGTDAYTGTYSGTVIDTPLNRSVLISTADEAGKVVTWFYTVVK